MTDLRTAAQQALEALEQAKETVADWGSYASEYFQQKHDLQGNLDAIQAQVTALKAALATAEPVWDASAPLVVHPHPAFQTAQPQRLPLTEGEIYKAYREICRDLPIDFDHTPAGWIEQGIRYAERAHGIMP